MKFKENRNFMKSRFHEEIVSDQIKELPQPDLTKAYDKDSRIITLPKVNKKVLQKTGVDDCIADRKTNREYKEIPITIDQLSYLLWATQGVKEIRGDNYATVRSVPSAGARHPFETYLAINNVEGLQKGIYRYLPMEHELMFVYEEKDIKKKIVKGTLNQKFVSSAAVSFVWACIPYRGEWRYDKNSHKVMLIDAGHICQSLYIACEALGLGTCALAAYDQKLMDEIIKVDGQDEYVVYMAPVGNI